MPRGFSQAGSGVLVRVGNAFAWWSLMGASVSCYCLHLQSRRGKSAVSFKLSISGNKHYVLPWSALPFVGN